MADETVTEEKTYCSTCADLKDNASEFYTRGVTENVCENLEDGTGFSGESTNCVDLHKANDCLMKTPFDTLDAFSTCDWKEWAEAYSANNYNMLEALICWLCGLDSLVFTNNLSIDTKYTIQQATPELSVSIDRKGNWTYKYSDWNSTAYQEVNRVARGTITGTLDYCMKRGSDNKAIYQINSVTVLKYKYETTGNPYPGSYPTITLRVPNKDGTVIYQKQTSESFEDEINKTVQLDLTGEIAMGAESDWIQFFHLYDDWVEDDEISLFVKFANNNQQAMPVCNE